MKLEKKITSAFISHLYIYQIIFPALNSYKYNIEMGCTILRFYFFIYAN